MPGGVKHPTSGSGRFAVAALRLVAIAILGIYAAKLTSFLSVKKTTLPFKTLDELAADDEFTIVLSSGGVQHLLLEVCIGNVIYANLIE